MKITVKLFWLLPVFGLLATCVLAQDAVPARALPQNAPEQRSYVGSQSCMNCHAQIYERWKKTPMANVVRDPREHPEAILPDLATNPFGKFERSDVALVYGSVWKQRYLTKV